MTEGWWWGERDARGGTHGNVNNSDLNIKIKDERKHDGYEKMRLKRQWKKIEIEYWRFLIGNDSLSAQTQDRTSRHHLFCRPKTMWKLEWWKCHFNSRLTKLTFFPSKKTRRLTQAACIMTTCLFKFLCDSGRWNHKTHHKWTEYDHSDICPSGFCYH